jgi:hypothetical protein
MRISYFILLTIYMMVGCTADVLPPDKYISWLNDPKNGLVSVVQGTDFNYNIRYKPYTEIGLTELRGQEMTLERLNSVTAELKGLEYYLLKISGASAQPDVLKVGATTETDYYERLNYLTFNFQSDIAMVVNNDTSMCSLYHLERDYGVAPYLKMLLAFPVGDTAFSYDREILIYPRIETNPEILKFNLKKEDFLHIPQLEIQN